MASTQQPIRNHDLRFRVMLETSSHIGGFGGWLTIKSDGIEVESSTVGKFLKNVPNVVKQTAKDVQWVKQPLFPFWINTSFDLIPDTNPGEIVRVRLTLGNRQHVKEAFKQLGYKLHPTRSWSLIFGP